MASKTSEKTDAQLQAVLQKNSGASVREVRSALVGHLYVKFGLL
jgi:hypothetical protein